MDALREAGRALTRRPSAAKPPWSSGRHRKLPENWTDTRETILEGMTFNLRHLGMTLVDQPKGEELSASAVKRIVTTAKASGKKPQKVSLKVCPQGIVLYDRPTTQLLEKVSIYRISYCTVDKLHSKVFAYITQNGLNGTLECHAYLCAKKREAQAVALTVAQAFTVAFELWQVAREDKGKRVTSGSAGDSSCSSDGSNSVGSLRAADVATEKLLELGGGGSLGAEKKVDPPLNCSPPETPNNPSLEPEDGLDEAFSRLAVSRTNPQVMDDGVTTHVWPAEADSLHGNNPLYWIL